MLPLYFGLPRMNLVQTNFPRYSAILSSARLLTMTPSRRSARLSNAASSLQNTPKQESSLDNATTQKRAAAQTTGSGVKRKRTKAGAATSTTLAKEQHVAFQTDAATEVSTDAAPSTPVRRRKPRPADPHVSNALLKTPRGSRVVAYPETQEEGKAEATKGPDDSVPKPTTTTESLLADACAHLTKVDPRLKALIDKHSCKTLSPEGLAEEIDPFASLVSGIIAQQVSGAAAQSIKNKFVALFDVPPNTKRPFPTPEQVASTDLTLLRTAGLSGRKAEYIKGLAEKFVSGELSARMLVQATDEEVLQRLTAVRGLGRWSVEMFSFFSLKRLDVFSTGDLGVQRGMAAYVGRDVSKLKAKGGKWKYMSEKDMLDIAAPFSPYRSLFMWYMWRVEDVNINAIAGD